MSEPFCLSIKDLQDLLAVLSDVHFDKTKWHDLGLALRLLEPDLKNIENKCSDSHECLRECLSFWLKSENTLPQVLASALDDILPVAAEGIRAIFCDRLNQYLISVSGQLTHVLFIDDIASLLYNEGLIDSTLRAKIAKKGNMLFDGAIRAICLKLGEDPSKLKVLADILLNCKKTESVGRTLRDEWISDQNRNETQESSDLNTDSEQVHIHVDVTQGHEQSFDTMRGTFGRFKDNISSLMNKIEEPVEIQKNFLERTFPELTSKLRSATTTKEIVDILLDDCTIINIAKIDTFVSRFNCGNNLVKEYRETLDEFCSIKLDKVLNKHLSPRTSSLKCEKIEIVLDWEPSEHSLKDIKLLLKHSFKDLYARVIVKTIAEGSSIIITCYAPQYLMDELQLTAEANLPALIEEYKLTRLRFGHHTVYDKIAKDKEMKEWEKDFLKKMHEKERESMHTGTRTIDEDSRKRKLKEEEPQQQIKRKKRQEGDPNHPMISLYFRSRKPNKGPTSSKMRQEGHIQTVIKECPCLIQNEGTMAVNSPQYWYGQFQLSSTTDPPLNATSLKLGIVVERGFPKIFTNFEVSRYSGRFSIGISFPTSKGTTWC